MIFESFQTRGDIQGRRALASNVNRASVDYAAANLAALKADAFSYFTTGKVAGTADVRIEDQILCNGRPVELDRISNRTARIGTVNLEIAGDRKSVV